MSASPTSGGDTATIGGTGRPLARREPVPPVAPPVRHAARLAFAEPIARPDDIAAGLDRASLDDRLAHGGFEALARARELGPEAVRRAVAEANLLGRGGAAFPTAVKWDAVAAQPAQPHYLVCNADESEPGTFKDRVLMERDPFALVEALAGVGLDELGEGGAARFQGAREAEHGLSDGAGLGAGQAHDPDAGAAGRGGDGDDGVVQVHARILRRGFSRMDADLRG